MKLNKFDLEHNPYNWWLRSVYFSSSYIVGHVNYYGCVRRNLTDGDSGVLQACIII